MAPKITFGATTIDLANYRVEVIPDWDQPKIIHESVLTGKKSIYYRDSNKKGRLTVRIRVFDSDATIDTISGQATVGFSLYGGARSDEMVVKSFKPFYSGNKYNIHSSASILLESQELITNPISHT